MEDLKYRLYKQGMTLPMYLSYMRQTEEELRASYDKGARDEVDASLALEAVAKKEGMEVSDGEFREHIQKISETGDWGGMSVDEIIEKIIPERKKEIIEELLRKKAMDFLVDKAVAVENEITGEAEAPKKTTKKRAKK
jgi:trigger factor